MNHVQFEEGITDYLEAHLDRSARREFAEHLLACRPCHELFNEVRAAMDDCHQLRVTPHAEIQQAELSAPFSQVEQRILNATTTGEMLSCRTLDALISDYFEGLIESSYEHVFAEHFAICQSCQRLVEGVRESLTVPEEIEVPARLYGKIYALTTGAVARSA